MDTANSPLISVIIVTYNSASYISQCLDAVYQNTEALFEAIVYDNASSDGTQGLVRDRFPEAKLIEGATNIGFAAACNHGGVIAQGEYLAFINPDAMVLPGWLPPLITVLQTDPSAGAVTPQITFTDRPEIVNTCGNEIHFSGIAYCREYGAPVSEGRPREVGAISGTAFVIRKRLFQELGGLETSFFMYYEDTDLSLRIRCAGLRCMAVYSSKVGHAYRPAFSPAKIFYLERNRYLSLLSLVTWPILVLMLPSLALMEAVAWTYCLGQGGQAMVAKATSWQDLIRKRHWIMTRRWRQRTHNANKRWTLGVFSAQLQVQYVSDQSWVMTAVLQGVGWLLAEPMLCLARICWV
jgi:GT2 family glycosyltransferase